MPYHWDFHALIQYRSLLLQGLGVTLLYTVGTVAAGLLIGLFAGLGRISRHRIVTVPLTAYVEAFRCTPLLVQLVWFYYAMPILVGVDIPAYLAGAIALSLYVGSFYSEIFRAGVISIERGQWDAGRALGMTRNQCLRRVVLPQAVKRMVPPFISQSVIQLKNTSLLSVIAVGDLLYQAGAVTSMTYRPLELYTGVAVLYFIVLYPLTLAAGGLERQLARAD
ncbi:MAG: amino acid ABC transporter permease [Acidisphaera sp.]|nr:amino acid ABC transporter permease [Acidisphaera sp.]